MTNTTIQKLTEYFGKFPGIGPRQAHRFVYFLLNKDPEFLSKLSVSISDLKKNTTRCITCQLFFEDTDKNQQCLICRNTSRDNQKLLILEKDVDLENIEKSGSYNGYYFILGGLLPAIGAEISKEIKMKTLFEKVKKHTANGLKEVVLAFNATQEGDNTARYIEKILEPITQKFPIKISRLGRGLSTGTELEYSDRETIENAFKNRQ